MRMFPEPLIRCLDWTAFRFPEYKISEHHPKMPISTTVGSDHGGAKPLEVTLAPSLFIRCVYTVAILHKPCVIATPLEEWMETMLAHKVFQ